MKPGTPLFPAMPETVRIAKQMQEHMQAHRDASAAASSQANPPGNSAPLGDHMQEQFKQHLQSAGAEAGEVNFIEPLIGLLDQECVQIVLLKTRVAFTKLVEGAMDEGDIFWVEDVVKRARAMVIGSLSQELPRGVRVGLNAMQVLLQEQQNTAADLRASADPVSMWDGEMRFYARHGGAFECRCAGLRAQVNPESMDRTQDSLLVTTEVTKRVRKAFFNAAFGGADVLLVDGVAGTGKTETCQDICHMLGMPSKVLDGSGLADLPLASITPFLHPGHVLIIDEANAAPRFCIENLVNAARDAGATVCFSCNLQRQKQDYDMIDVLGAFCAYVQTEVPPYAVVLSSMLANEGLQEADDLGNRLNGLFDFFKTHCTKQSYYDFGLRKLRAVTREAGKAARTGVFTDERKVLTAAVQASCAAGMAPADEHAFLQGIVQHFGADAFVPMPVPRDFWNAAATKLSRTIAARHASACLPVLESEETFVMAVLEEEAARLGVRLACMPGRMADLSQDDVVGGFVNGEWRDGVFAKAVRELASCEQPGWLIIFCGDESYERGKWDRLNSLLDDNRTLRLENGENITIKPDDRIIFAARSLDGASPATVSRMGIVNVETHHRNRL